MKGFEEFMEGEADKSFMGRQNGGTKKDTNFEHFTFLTSDAERLARIKNLLTEKMPFAHRYEQGKQLLKDQKTEVNELRTKIFSLSNKPESPYRKSMGEIFDSYFKQSDG